MGVRAGLDGALRAHRRGGMAGLARGGDGRGARGVDCAARVQRRVVVRHVRRASDRPRDDHQPDALAGHRRVHGARSAGEPHRGSAFPALSGLGQLRHAAQHSYLAAELNHPFRPLLLGRNGPFTAQKAVKLRHLPPAGRPAARCLNALIQFDEAGAEAIGAIAAPALR